MKAVIFLLPVLLVGCKAPPPDWTSAPRDHVCTVEQMERVQSEAGWCIANTSYFSDYCYGTAFIRNCTKAADQASEGAQG